MDIYGALYRRLLLPLYEERIRGRKTLQYLSEMEASQWLPREEVARRQWDKVQEMLAYCEREVPYYGKLFAEAGIKAAHIQTPADLRKVPILTKDHVRQCRPEMIARPFQGKKLASVASSGSTGSPVEVLIDHDCYERRVAGWYRGDRWAGWDIGKKIFLLVGGRPRTAHTPKYKLLKKRLYNAITRTNMLTTLTMSEKILMQYYEEMNRYRAPVIVAYGNSLYHFARLIQQRGLKPYRPEGIIVCAEKIHEPQKRLIEEVFQTKTFERYGCMEFSFISGECDHHKGMHLNCDNLYVEIVNDRGEPAKPGEVGQFLITSLHNRAMPMVRYRIGDLGRWADGPCTCGRGLPLIAEVLGRTLDMIVTRSGLVCTGIVFPYVLDMFPEIVQYQAIQETIDDLVIKIVPREGFDTARFAAMEAEVRRFVGSELRIRFELVKEIPLSATGKFPVFQSKVAVPFGERPSAPMADKKA